MPLVDLLTLHNLDGWSLATGLIGLFTMWVDKETAIHGEDRVPEVNLWLIALVGGFWGIIFGGLIFNHKTSKASFWVPVGFATTVWLAILVYLVVGYFRI
jgi:uncharacterized membrane protein YsdA (DUF1294 family)